MASIDKTLERIKKSLERQFDRTRVLARKADKINNKELFNKLYGVVEHLREALSIFTEPVKKETHYNWIIEKIMLARKELMNARKEIVEQSVNDKEAKKIVRGFESHILRINRNLLNLSKRLSTIKKEA